jgi:hypothetical protein
VSADPTRAPEIEALLLKGRTLGDTSTLADAAVVDTIREHSGQAED